MMESGFEWPWQYSFPPFFTIQPNTDTRTKQLEDWCSLLLQYCKYHSIYKIDIGDAQSSSLFWNKAINRRLQTEGINSIMERLKDQGNLEWEDSKTKNRCFVYWRTPEEWADVINAWVKTNGLDDTVCTLYELTSEEGVGNDEFKGIDMFVLKKALQVLERRGKAQLIVGDDTMEEGVKFFS
ncbi:vacuolar protein-sorting-associated protein 25-like [Rhopilema esculentum]|uniref:vacuolar protein-sorting-associated protein 25-like n=1 Tax=Rhopilema esculentum TaxID=499914 RepID=UPI0031E2624A